MSIVKNRNIFFGIAIALVIFSIGAMAIRGLHFGIDFTGGSVLQVSYTGDRPQIEEVKNKIDTLSIGEYSLRPTGDKSFVLRTKELNNDEKIKAIQALSLDPKNPAKEDRFNTTGPVVGNELRNKSYVAIVVTILGIVLFITFAFRKVSEPVSSWKYGIATIITLAFDIVVPAGIYIALSYITGAEIDLLFLTALLAILGYSVHDTIVVFDRVRENLRVGHQTKKKENFEEVVGRSITQTFGRSINTSLTIVLVLLAVYFLGSESTKNFSLLMTLGVISGTYSSIFLASPLLIVFARNNK
ncbi:MAG TPA: protein translocase subunit SecF [Candidatus Nanoarchaeia archaeon]|nr:protein translocase subunit SecF [Candidatus Nanoarchaeia archaeon]